MILPFIPQLFDAQPLDSEVSFIDAPGIVGGQQMGTTPPIYFCSILLHPAINRCVIHLNPPFPHQLFNVSVAQGIAAIPPNRLQDDLWEEVSPFERRLKFHVG
jgi:hypothetical protein